jgi:uncharacterized DUF497 family protein
MFEWDDSNTNHIADHGLYPEDVEEAFLDKRRIRTNAYNSPFEKRLAIIGKTSFGLILKVVYTKRGDKVRVVTAMEANNAQKSRYRKGRK